jgi:transcriptional regulator with PAS, ATPase and Fis domain
MKRDMSEMRQQLNGLLANKPVSAPVQPVQQEEYQTVEVLHDEAPTNIATLERDSIRRALERNGGNRKLAADELGISERTLYRKIKDYGL